MSDSFVNEALRLQYLDAMGVTQYVPRAPLPGARPSPAIAIILPEQHHIPENEQTARITTALLMQETTAKKPALAVVNRRSHITGADTPGRAPAAATTFQCQIAIWIVEDLLILVETTRLDNAQLALLRNILAAIGRHSELPGPQLFGWPLRERREKSLEAARDHFQGWLDGGLLKTAALRQIVCFGQAPQQLLATQENTGSHNYHHWPVLSVSSLQTLLETPANKAHTWRTLQPLLRS